ncbi:hypothetical protein K488DRAFT_34101, partial [Vararia minispora EC-137]
MDRVPVEVWEHIFSLACTDDGETGRSLSSVSHYVQSASARYKHQSIRIKNPAHVRAFVKLLEWSPQEMRRVRTLALS